MLIRSRPQLVGGGNFIFLPLVLIAATVIPSPVSAGEEEDAEVVEIRAERVPEVSNCPSSLVTVVEAEDLGHGVVTTSDMVRAAPAVRIREHGGLGQFTTVGIRGAAPHQTLVTLDGVVLADPLGTGVDLSLVPSTFLDRLEVLRGPASALYGSGALGGVVNLVTREMEGRHYWTRLSGGSFGSWLLNAGGTFSVGSARFLAVGSGLSTQGDFSFIDNQQTEYNPSDDRLAIRKNNQAHRGGLLLKADWRLPSGASLRVTQQYAAMDRGVPGLLGVSRLHALHARESGWSGLLHLKGNVPLGDAAVTGGAWAMVSGRHFQDPEGELSGVPTDDRQEYETLGVFSSVLMPWQQKHTLRGRVEFSRTSLRDPDFSDPRRWSLVGSVSAEFNWLDGRLVLFPLIGVAYDSDADWQAIPTAGIAYRLAGGLWVKANFARAYRAPNFAELYWDGGYTQGNPDLSPENGWAFDAGLEWTPDKDWRLVAAGFYTRIEDIIIFETLFDPQVAGFIFKPFGTESAELGGAELEVSGRILRGLEVSGHYTFLVTADRSGKPNRDGNELPGRPQHTASVRVKGRWRQLIAEGETHYVASNYINRANTKDLSSRLLLHAGLGVEVAEGVTVMIQGKNLLNDQVYDVRGLPLPGISFFLTIGVTQGERR